MRLFRFIALAALLGLPTVALAEPKIQVGFSPEGSARQLVLDTINSAKSSIQMLAYAFQARDITQALVEARQRGVDVKVVIDKRRNLGKASKSAMDFVARNGVQLRTSAAVISPIGGIQYNGKLHVFHSETEVGPITQQLYKELTGVQTGVWLLISSIIMTTQRPKPWRLKPSSARKNRSARK